MKIKITDLKKQLKGYDQKELIELIVAMYKSNKEVQNYLSSKFLGDQVIEVLFHQTQKKIKNEFFPERGTEKLRLTEAKKEITAFKKATNDEKLTVDLMLFYVEMCVKFTNSYGDINEGFYTSLVRMFDKVAMECDRDEELYKAFSNRLRNIISNVDLIGWGVEEAIIESYYSIEWVHGEDENDDE